jgi:hypothetical protein
MALTDAGSGIVETVVGAGMATLSGADGVWLEGDPEEQPTTRPKAVRAAIRRAITGSVHPVSR